MQGGDAWAGSEYKVRLLASLLPKLRAKLGLLAMRYNSAMAQHARQLLEQVESRYDLLSLLAYACVCNHMPWLQSIKVLQCCCLSTQT